jgi:hypothetical protein
MRLHEIIAELPKLSEEERELILRKLVNLDEPFEATPAMEDAIRVVVQFLIPSGHLTAR